MGQCSTDVEKELYKRQKNYQKMLKQLEIIRVKRIQEVDECENLKCVLNRETETK